MFTLRKHLGEDYSPLYFLAALGAGGLSISFFMYLMFMTPHPATPIPTWDSISAVFASDHIILKVLSGVSLTGIALFAILHVRLLVWNISEYQRYKHTESFLALQKSNAEVQLMAIPLTYAMSINVAFVLGALFIPGLWHVVEYLFPAALLAFSAVGLYAGRIFITFLSRVLVHGSFDCSRNNNLSQMLAIFAFGMISVGLAAPAAMSHVQLTSGIALVLSIVFITVAGLLAFTKLILGFRAMFEHGIDREASVSLWIIIPIITVAGLALYRLTMGMEHNFGVHHQPVETLVFFAVLVSIQVLFALLGYNVMRKLGYFSQYLYGKAKSAASFALICPGVAAYVLAFFFIHKGLVATGLLEVNSVAYLLLLAPLVWLQIKTITTLFTLNNKLLHREKAMPA